ncbi:GNAT family N-acetyltransferase [Geminicoccus roseus]|uniref:GNAT family N-acetyltransferase n=1 Tax=Geminicoccus roseus TaxID=404900 RepID=UPI000406012F|nr:GNAT family N-acetyltransferase [Geminicoccus roseus]
MTEVRPGSAADLPELAAVERSAARRFAGTHMAWVVEAPVTAPDRLRQALDERLLWVATVGSRPAGFLMASELAGDLFVEEVSVALDRQGQGLGRRLLEAAVQAARARGLAGVALTTDRTIAWNAPFYRRFGFRLLDAPPPALQARLAGEADHGLDPARRCAMRLALA